MLTIKNLTKHFDNRTIIDHLNLEIPDGKILTIVGPSGGGKNHFTSLFGWFRNH